MKIILSAIALLIFPVRAPAGVDSSGGGYAVVCREANGHIVSATLLDLYEAVNRDGLTLRRSAHDLDQDFLQYAEWENWVFADTLGQPYEPISPGDRPGVIADFHQALREKFVFLPSGTPVEGNPDWGTTIPIPPGCALEAAARYHDDDSKVRVNSDIWNAFDSFDKVALFAHETIYAPYRFWGDKTSENAREVVGHVFSTAPRRSVREGIAKPAFQCGTSIQPVNGVAPRGVSDFYVYKDPQDPGATVLQFTLLFDRLTYAPLKITLPIPFDATQYNAPTPSLLVVKNPAANIDRDFLITDGIFRESSLRVRFVHDQPMEVGMTDSKGNLLFSAYVLNQCSAAP